MADHPKDLFISYNHADKAWAEWIAWTLEEAGYTVVIQAWDFRAGGNFVLQMQQAAEATHKTIAVLSQNYLDAEFTQPEWAAAFVRDPQGKEQTLIPVRVKACQPTGLLGPIVYVDLVSQQEVDAQAALLSAFSERGKPSQKPGFPGGTAAQRSFPSPVSYPSASTIWHLPYPRNPFFTGRDEILNRLHNALTQDGTAALTQTQAISGLGGIGKTQIAIEYAYRHREDYDAVLWVGAQSRPATLR